MDLSSWPVRPEVQARPQIASTERESLQVGDLLGKLSHLPSDPGGWPGTEHLARSATWPIAKSPTWPMSVVRFHGTLLLVEFAQKEKIMIENSRELTEQGPGDTAEDRASVVKDHVLTGQLNRLCLILDLCALVAAVLWVNVFPDKVGVLISATDSVTFVPLLAPEFQMHMPTLNLWWSLAVLLTVIKLVYGRWTVMLRWADLGLRVMGVYVLVSLILGGPLLRPEAGWGWLDNLPWGPFGKDLALQPDTLLKLGLGLWAAILTAKLVPKLLYLAKVAPLARWDLRHSN